MSRKKIGLALGCGGWRGMSHIGVIKALVENDIPIDYIAGTSAGSLIGGLYAYFQDIEKVESIYKSFTHKDLFNAFSDIRVRGGFVTGKKLVNTLDKHLNKVQIEDLKIPFIAVCTDLLTAQKYEISKGSLAEAIKVSTSIPVLIRPTHTEDHLLVDGGLVSPLPVVTAQKMGSDIVIAVDTIEKIFPIAPIGKKLLKSGLIAQISLRVGINNLSITERNLADIVISPKIPGAERGFIGKIASNKGTIDYGYKAAQEMMGEIKNIIV